MNITILSNASPVPVYAIAFAFAQKPPLLLTYPP